MFGNGKSNAEKQEEKKEELKQRFIEMYHLDELDDKDFETLQHIVGNVGSGFWRNVSDLTATKPDEIHKIQYLSALVDQNFLIINLLNRLNKNIEKLQQK